MRKFSIYGLGVLIALITSCAFANIFIHRPHEHGLFALTVTTPHKKPFKTDQDIFYAGSSTNACSDMKAINSVPGDELTPGTFAMNSSDLRGIPGPNMTCFRIDFVAHGKTFSTGDLKLIWDASTNEYTAVLPSTARIDFK